MYFKLHVDQLKDDFAKSNPHLTLDLNNTDDIIARHSAFLDELKVNFSSALGKERMYHRPCGFLNDQQIWLVGVLMKYFETSVLRFNHRDFMAAMRQDLGPILGELGLWILRCRLDEAKAAKNAELKKKLQVMIDLVEKYMETGLDVLEQEKKYHFINKYSPKKCPEQQVTRDSIKHIYSW